MSGRVARLKPGDVDQAIVELRAHGAVLIEGLWSAALIDEMREYILAEHPELSEPATLADKLDSGPQRFIAPVRLTPRIYEARLATHPVLDAICAGLLGEQYVHEAFGLMMTRSGAPDQHVHRDTDPLFPETGVDPLLPPTVLTIAIPLVDVGPENGQTTLYPGSHRTGTADGIEAASLPVARGSVLIWDFRTIHFGRANTTAHDRPMLYLTTCRPFWFDHKNFRKGNRRLIAEPGVMDQLGQRFARAEIG